MQTLTAQIQPVSDAIATVCEFYPDSIALCDAESAISYEELGRRANEFASYLLSQGIGPNCTVAIAMERSFDWIVAALGIQWSGAAFVPLDIAWPQSRLRFAIKDSEAKAVVARTALLDRLNIPVLGIDIHRDGYPMGSAPSREIQTVELDSLAYIVYTSGSTGQPKGVEITHANLAHLVRWHRKAFNLSPTDRVSHLAGLGFDAAIWEIWGSLAAGATLCLPEEDVRSSPQLIQEWMVRERVTLGFVPTVHATQMIKMPWPKQTALRVLLTGGDALTEGPPYGLPFSVVNNYGPTECTVVATSAILPAGIAGVPSIGSPIDDTSVYLLNEHGEQVGDGEIGEIYIGGDGVGRGYRNHPDLTAKSFLIDPFLKSDQADPLVQPRMYRTGDLGARLPDGQIQFHGRNDRQTKIRGQRVELDEISAALAKYPDLDFAVVTARKSDVGDNQLLGYILPRPGTSMPSSKAVQEFLLRTLPDYMVPAIYVELKAAPLSPNGKIDLKLLPLPGEIQQIQPSESVPDLNPLELELLTIIRQLLSNDKVQPDDNFFLAGGHSLLGMQLVLKMRTRFKVELSLRQLFEASTPRQLARLIDFNMTRERLATIWKRLLGTQSVQNKDSFFSSEQSFELVGQLQQAIEVEFAKTISTSELIDNPKLIQQVELLQGRPQDVTKFPSGVMALQPLGSRASIFWVHYLSANLAKVIGEDQPFLHVGLTMDDFDSLGDVPTMQTIGACFVKKIVATQPKGPYTVGGFCLGGILAYEIALQLRQMNHHVELLVLLDPPSPPYLESHDPMSPQLRHVGYLWKRVKKLGFRESIVRMRQRLRKEAFKASAKKTAENEMEVAQALIQAAAFGYKPAKYHGKVLLLLASERPPHLDFIPGWQEVIPNGLHSQYLEGHHSELTKPANAHLAANAIKAQLEASSLLNTA